MRKAISQHRGFATFVPTLYGVAETLNGRVRWYRRFVTSCFGKLLGEIEFLLRWMSQNTL